MVRETWATLVALAPAKVRELVRNLELEALLPEGGVSSSRIIQQ